MERISVLLADDHPVVRQGLRTLLELQDDIELVGEAADGAEAVARAEELLPDVVLIDLVMPELEGVEALRRIRTASPATRVIVLTSFGDDARIFPAIKAGAAGYLLKDVEPQELLDAIRRVHRGEGLLHPAVAGRVMRELARGAGSGVEPLSARELDVLRLIAPGPVEQGDRAAARDLREDRQDTCVEHPGQAPPRRPHAGGALCRAGAPGGAGVAASVRRPGGTRTNDAVKIDPPPDDRRGRGPYSRRMQLESTKNGPRPTIAAGLKEER